MISLITGTSLTLISFIPSSFTSIVSHEVSLWSIPLINADTKAAATPSKPNCSNHADKIAVEAPHIVEIRLAFSTPSSQGSQGKGESPHPPMSMTPLPLASYAQ